MSPHLQALHNYLENLDLPQVAIEQLRLLLRNVGRDQEAIDFKMKRTLKDKQIVTSVLNTTIDDLEQKKSEIERANAELMLQKNEIEVINSALNDKNRLIEEESKYKDRFFANISHELRTPLNGILGISNLLSNTPLSPVQKEYNEIVLQSAGNLASIINDLLDLATIGKQQFSLKEQVFSLPKMLNGLFHTQKIHADHKHVSLNFSVSDSTPSFIKGDSLRLYQVLNNLLNNAIKFTQKGGVKLIITPQKQEENQEWLQFEVIDSGIGIDSDKLSAIFEEFVQVHDKSILKNIQEGVGLGLNIARQLVGIMKGTIEVQSKKGEGTAFTVLLPFTKVADTDAEMFLQNRMPVSHKPVNWKDKKILVLEDNEVNIIYIKNLLSQWQITADYAVNIAQVFEKVQDKVYDCIFADIGLPDGSGLDFIDEVQQNAQHPNANAAFIVLTAAASEEALNHAKALNLKGYLLKPFEPIDLFEQLTKLFSDTSSIEAQPVPNEKAKPTNGATNGTTNRTTNGTSNIPIFLEKLLAKLGGSEQLLVEMIEIFEGQYDVAKEKIGQSLPVQDWGSVYFESHKLKSTANILGLTQLRDILVKMEKNSRTRQQLDVIPQLFEQFVCVGQQAKDQLTPFTHLHKQILN